MPASDIDILNGVGLKQSVINRHVTIRAAATCFAWLEQCHIGHAYVPKVYESQSLVVRSICEPLPKLLR